MVFRQHLVTIRAVGYSRWLTLEAKVLIFLLLIHMQTIDALGRKRTGAYNPLGWLTSAADALANVMQFAYDKVGNLTSVIDAKGNRATFTYDGVNRLVSATDPLGHLDTRTYDVNGNLSAFFDRRGRTSQFSYDTLNRPIGENYTDSVVSRSYDANSRLLSVRDSAGGSVDFTYDSTGQLLSSATQFGTIQYQYDAGGRTTLRQVVGQSSLAYSYDAAGELLSATLPQGAVNFAYDSDTRLQNITRANGVSSTLRYDAGSRLLALNHSGGQGINLPLAYSYDAVGNRSLQDTNVGQPLVTQAVTNTFDNANRLLTSGATSYSYDANGNLVSSTGPGGTITYTWDSRNRLASITSPGQNTTFIYDFLGNLISTNDSGSLNLTRSYVLDDLTDVAYVAQSNGDNLSVLAGRALDQHLAIIHSSGQVEYGVPDAINSTIATVDQTGKLLSTLLYEPFGQTATSSNYLFQFAGRTAVATNLYYYRARYYASSDGRFISEDPIASDVNLYRYVYNAPILFTDPTGLHNAAPYYHWPTGPTTIDAGQVCGFAAPVACFGLGMLGGGVAGGVACGLASIPLCHWLSKEPLFIFGPQDIFAGLTTPVPGVGGLVCGELGNFLPKRFPNPPPPSPAPPVYGCNPKFQSCLTQYSR